MRVHSGETRIHPERYRDILIRYRATRRYRVSYNNIARSAVARACGRVIAYRLLDPVQLIRALMAAARLLRYSGGPAAAAFRLLHGLKLRNDLR